MSSGSFNSGSSGGSFESLGKRFDPSQGVVAGSATPHPPVVEGPWGPSGPSGSILRLHIAITDTPKNMSSLDQAKTLANRDFSILLVCHEDNRELR